MYPTTVESRKKHQHGTTVLQCIEKRYLTEHNMLAYILVNVFRPTQRLSARNYPNKYVTRMWADAQRDGRPAEYRWRPLLNAAKFG